MDNKRSGRPRLAPIQKIDVFRAILSQMEDLIRGLNPGDRLGSERELAEQLDVSRVSVREALRALESMGKVEIRRNSGTFVSQRPPHVIDLRPPDEVVDDAYLRQVAQVRAAIECQVLRSFASRPEANLEPVREAIDRTARDINAEDDDVSLDVRFEVALGRESGNPVLAEFQRAIQELWLQAWMRLGGGVGPHRQFHHEHMQILAALEAREIDDAIRLMAVHIDPHSEEPATT